MNDMPMPGMHGTPISGMTLSLPSFVVMMAVAGVVLAQKLFAPRPVLDLSLALALVALGSATAAA